jgi:branched-chain amino acid transport system permease protein
MTAYVLSAAPAALAGAIYAHAILFVVTPDGVFGVIAIVQTLTVCLVGGVGTLWGPVIGAAFFILARDLLGATTEAWLLWYGLLFMAVVLFRPEGIVGAWRMLRQRVIRPLAERN